MCPMLRDLGSRTRVNVLKKVKVRGVWKFCPVVLESNGRLKDKVRVEGRIEEHAEGAYYIEWREHGQRRRAPVRERGQVLEHARLKALEMDARKAGVDREVIVPMTALRSTQAPPALLPHLLPHAQSSIIGSLGNEFGTVFLRAFEHLFTNAVRSVIFAQSNPDSSCCTNGTLAPAVPASAERVEIKPDRTPEVIQNASTSEKQKPGKTSIGQAIDSFLKDIEPPQREPKTYQKYQSTLDLFRKTCDKQYLDDVTRDDCLSFIRHLYSIGNQARTAHNRIMIVLQFLKLHGISGLLKGRDLPKYVETAREMYSPEELEALFKACDPDEKIRYLFFLLSGERDQEVQFTGWSDIDFTRKCVRVTSKKELAFTPKDKEEREIPVPASLLEALKAYRTRQSGSNPYDLLFPTATGQPDRNFENKLKKIAHRSGLNCGRCLSKHKNQCSQGPYCGKWFLHKFRHTFATSCLENGVSIRSLQEWLGHSDLESTTVYLKYVHNKEIHQLVDNTHNADYAGRSDRSPQQPNRSSTR